MKKIIAISAFDTQGLMGYNNQDGSYGSARDLPEDFEHFLSTVHGHITIMGRKTAQALKDTFFWAPLIYLSRDNHQLPHTQDTAFHANWFETAQRLADILSREKFAYLIGWGEIFKQALDQKFIDEMILTEIFHTFELPPNTTPVYFPEFEEDDRIVQERTDVTISSSSQPQKLPYNITRYQRKNSERNNYWMW